MTQKRELRPVTTYLPPDLIERIEQAASPQGLALATQIRADLLAKYPAKRKGR